MKKLSPLLVVACGLFLGVGLARPSVAQPTLERADRLWIVDSHGKIVGTSFGSLAGQSDPSWVWLKVGSRLVKIRIQPSGVPFQEAAYYELTDCQGPPLLADFGGFYTPYMVAQPGQTLYLPDTSVAPQTVLLRSHWDLDSARCVSDGQTAPAWPAAPAVDLATQFTPPFRLTLAPSDVQHVIDQPAANATVGASFVVSGWALDPSASTGTGIDTFHIYAYRRDVNLPPQFLGVPQVILRPDVAAIYGPQFGPSGYSLTTPALAPGPYDISSFLTAPRQGRSTEPRRCGQPFNSVKATSRV